MDNGSERTLSYQASQEVGCGGAPNDSGAIYFSCPMAKGDEDEWGMILLRAENSEFVFYCLPSYFLLYTHSKNARVKGISQALMAPWNPGISKAPLLRTGCYVLGWSSDCCWQETRQEDVGSIFGHFLSFFLKNTLFNRWTSWDLLSMFLRILECNLSNCRFHSCNPLLVGVIALAWVQRLCFMVRWSL